MFVSVRCIEEMFRFPFVYVDSSAYRFLCVDWTNPFVVSALTHDLVSIFLMYIRNCGNIRNTSSVVPSFLFSSSADLFVCMHGFFLCSFGLSSIVHPYLVLQPLKSCYCVNTEILPSV
uniref:Uncharacterized protein n=1 Tax=Arundo donax TaxID=35708 RepID=A0A0A9DNK3_ARUDO